MWFSEDVTYQNRVYIVRDRDSCGEKAIFMIGLLQFVLEDVKFYKTLEQLRFRHTTAIVVCLHQQIHLTKMMPKQCSSYLSLPIISTLIAQQATVGHMLNFENVVLFKNLFGQYNLLLYYYTETENTITKI